MHFEENDECQYSLSERLDIHQSFLNNVKDIQKRRWKRKRQRNIVIK